jgi:hypothetical protein
MNTDNETTKEGGFTMKRFFRNFIPFVHIPIIMGGLVIVFVLSFLFGLFVMFLWNWLMPAIFGLPIITYWQAWGLVILAHLLFKGGHGDYHSRHKDRGDEWKNKFRSRMKEYFYKDTKDTEEGTSVETDPGQTEEGEA